MSDLTVVSLPELAVQQRYSAAAQAREESLCCPLEYPTELLKVIPQEILERDYGCGDPTSHIHPGETVLDLGAGGGKLCYITAQVVGPQGRVIGVDCNREILGLARKYQKQVAEAVEARGHLLPTTAAGNKSVAEQVMRPLYEQDHGLDPLKEHRSIQKNVRTYLAN